MGIIFGYPVGVGFATLIFKTIGFGSVSDVKWFMWLLIPIIIYGFTLLVTLILKPKIVKKKNEWKFKSGRVGGIFLEKLWQKCLLSL